MTWVPMLQDIEIMILTEIYIDFFLSWLPRDYFLKCLNIGFEVVDSMASSYLQSSYPWENIEKYISLMSLVNPRTINQVLQSSRKMSKVFIKGHNIGNGFTINILKLLPRQEVNTNACKVILKEDYVVKKRPVIKLKLFFCPVPQLF